MSLCSRPGAVSLDKARSIQLGPDADARLNTSSPGVRAEASPLSVISRDKADYLWDFLYGIELYRLAVTRLKLHLHIGWLFCDELDPVLPFGQLDHHLSGYVSQSIAHLSLEVKWAYVGNQVGVRT